MSQPIFAYAVEKGIDSQPRKVNIVASLVRDRYVADAVVILENTPRRAAKAVTARGPWMLKAQIQSGARGSGRFLEAKAGSRSGIRMVSSLRDLGTEAEAMLGSTLVTRQTGPRGKQVSRLYVEAYTKVGFTFYAGMAIDRVQAAVTLLLANTRDDDINTIAESAPGQILRLPIDLVTGPTHAQTGRAAEFLKLQPRSYDSFYAFLRGLFKTFMANDALMIEINPAGVMKNGDIIALDAKISLDDKALFRHPEHERLKDDDETPPRELKAAKYGFTYHEFGGSIGCIVNGEGLAMAMTGYEARVVVNSADYSFSLEFLGESNTLADIDVSQVRNMVEQIKPAHLRFIISGLTWADVESVGLTWQWFEDNPTTWEQFESKFCVHKKD